MNSSVLYRKTKAEQRRITRVSEKKSSKELVSFQASRPRVHSSNAVTWLKVKRNLVTIESLVCSTAIALEWLKPQGVNVSTVLMRGHDDQVSNAEAAIKERVKHGVGLLFQRANFRRDFPGARRTPRQWLRSSNPLPRSLQPAIHVNSQYSRYSESRKPSPRVFPIFLLSPAVVLPPVQQPATSPVITNEAN